MNNFKIHVKFVRKERFDDKDRFIAGIYTEGLPELLTVEKEMTLDGGKKDDSQLLQLADFCVRDLFAKLAEDIKEKVA